MPHDNHELTTHSTQGLSSAQVTLLQKQYGPNALPEPTHDSFYRILLRQFNNPFIYLLLLAALFKFFLQDYPDAGIIVGIVIINALIGATQESRAYKVLSNLKKILQLTCIVIRDGHQKIIPAQELVPGDSIVLQEGERVPADARVLQATDLKLDESMFTGESQAVIKDEKNNQILMGSALLMGKGVAIVTATGSATELGRLKQSTEQITNEIPLKGELDELATIFLFFTIFASIGLFIIGIIRGMPLETMVLTLTSLFVSIVPKGIPIISTIVLAIGTYRMAQAHVLVKRMTAIETLGRLETLVVDKTGTLTYNEQMVMEVFAGDNLYTVTGRGYKPEGKILRNDNAAHNVQGDSHLIALARAATLLDHSLLEWNPQDQSFILKGEPLQAALGVFAHKLGLEKERIQEECPLLEEFPFDSEARLSGGYYQCGHQAQTLLIGSPEAIFARCTQKLTREHEACANMLAKGLRVVAIARTSEKPTALHSVELLGILGMQDAIRPEVHALVQQARSAGLRIVMATGDHLETALYVGTQTGIYQKNRGDETLEGKDFQNLEEEELNTKLLNTTIIARVTPQDKLDIIRAYHYKGIIVGMTGDGVNDAPALVAANVGIAMGKIGTEVAQSSADIILLDDSLQSIFAGIIQGRTIIATLRRVISFLLAINISEVLLIGLTLVFGLPLPLLALQLLWQHLLTDSFLDVGLSLEPAEKKIRPPTKGQVRLFDRSLFIKLCIDITTAVGGTLSLFIWYAQTDIVLARTMVLVTFSFFQWFNAWNLRSESRSLFTMNPFANIWLLIITVCIATLQILAINNHVFSSWLHLTPLTQQQWCIAGFTASFIIVFEEIRKFCVRRQWI